MPICSTLWSFCTRVSLHDLQVWNIFFCYGGVGAQPGHEGSGAVNEAYIYALGGRGAVFTFRTATKSCDHVNKTTKSDQRCGSLFSSGSIHPPQAGHLITILEVCLCHSVASLHWYPQTLIGSSFGPILGLFQETNLCSLTYDAIIQVAAISLLLQASQKPLQQGVHVGDSCFPNKVLEKLPHHYGSVAPLHFEAFLFHPFDREDTTFSITTPIAPQKLIESVLIGFNCWNDGGLHKGLCHREARAGRGCKFCHDLVEIANVRHLPCSLQGLQIRQGISSRLRCLGFCIDL
mmetsp:Transcript_22503/g.46692  ORF Transcript_22503/g.46692 Transcript_22503/m.46692 type:complete len:291 (+) Transcript_22503:732-1604(+)